VQSSSGASTPNSPLGGYSDKSTPTQKEGGIILKKPQIENFNNFDEEEKNMKIAKNVQGENTIETLYTLFLNHLLKPKEWASNEGGIADNEMDRFYFRNNFILSLVDE